MKQAYQVLNILSVAFALVMNYLVGAQAIRVPSIKDVSDRYATFLTPATYAFAIWGLIYLLLIIFAVYQARDLFRPNKNNTLPERAGPYFLLANIGNGVWTYIFVSGLIGLSVITIIAMAVALFMLLLQLDIAMYNAKVRTILCVWWPIMLYSGWVFVASVVNISSWLASRGIYLSQFAVLAVLVCLCCALGALLYARSVRELVLAATWGIVAIGIRQLQTDGSMVVTTAAFTVGSILLAAVAIHGYQNRDSNLLAHILQ